MTEKRALKRRPKSATPSDDRLNTVERKRWKSLRNKVSKQVEGMWEMFADLREIRDKRLYREDFRTFEAYVRDELGIDRTYAYRMIDAREQLERVAATGVIAPGIDRESQLRELKDVPDDALGDVVSEAARIAGEGRPTAKVIKEAKDRVVADRTDFVDNCRQSGQNDGATTVDAVDVETIADTPDEESAAAFSEAELAIRDAPRIREIHKAVRAASKLLDALEPGPATGWIDTRRQPIAAALADAANQIYISIPHSICPRCGGDGCVQCGNLGFVNAALARELKG